MKIPKPLQIVIAELAFSNSDLAFQGDHLFQGNFYGVNIYDISNPAQTALLTSMVCPGGQGDVSVYKNLLFMSVEMPNGRLDCGTQGFPPEPPPAPGHEKERHPPAAHRTSGTARRPAGVGTDETGASAMRSCVGDVQPLAAGQPPMRKLSIVPDANFPAAARPQRWVLLQEPAGLRGGKIRIEDEAVACATTARRAAVGDKSPRCGDLARRSPARPAGRWPAPTARPSRWLVTPIAIQPPASMPAAASASGMTSRPTPRFPWRHAPPSLVVDSAATIREAVPHTVGRSSYTTSCLSCPDRWLKQMVLAWCASSGPGATSTPWSLPAFDSRSRGGRSRAGVSASWGCA